MEKEQDLQLAKEYQEKMKPEKHEQAEFRMPEKGTQEYGVIKYNSEAESGELGKDIFYKLNPEFSGKGHIPANIDEKNILSIETFKPETQNRREQGGFDKREKPLGFVEINKNPDKGMLIEQNKKYLDTMESLIKKYEKSIQENPNPRHELQLDQLKKQLELYGTMVFGHRSHNSEYYKIGIKALISSGAKKELATQYYHRLNSEEEVKKVEKIFKELGISDIDSYLSKEEKVGPEFLEKDLEIRHCP